MLNKILFIFIVLILLIPNVKSLGTLQKKSYLEIKSGQIATFSILFWNQEPLEIELKEKVVPEKWVVIVEPKKFILNDSITSSEVIRVQNSYIKALPVNVLAIPPEDVEPGSYEIIINMIAGKNDKEISFFQEKNFNFKVNIQGQLIEQKENSTEPINKYITKTGNFTLPFKETENISSSFTRTIFWLIIILITLLFCWVLYKL
jgi:uncharacterized membrane protein